MNNETVTMCESFGLLAPRPLPTLLAEDEEAADSIERNVREFNYLGTGLTTFVNQFPLPTASRAEPNQPPAGSDGGGPTPSGNPASAREAPHLHGCQCPFVDQ